MGRIVHHLGTRFCRYHPQIILYRTIRDSINHHVCSYGMDGGFHIKTTDQQSTSAGDQLAACRWNFLYSRSFILQHQEDQVQPCHLSCICSGRQLLPLYVCLLLCTPQAMSSGFFELEDYKDVDFTESGFPKGDYEQCTFHNCHLNEADLSGINFTECFFETCDLSLAKLRKTAFKDVRFKDCKLLGLRFDECNTFLLEIRFETCLLNLSSFYQLVLKGLILKNCQLREVDFSQADLANADFSGSDLLGAMFDHANLEGADLRSAINFSIDPENNRIKNAQFATSGLMGLLEKYDIRVDG